MHRVFQRLSHGVHGNGQSVNMMATSINGSKIMSTVNHGCKYTTNANNKKKTSMSTRKKRKTGKKKKIEQSSVVVEHHYDDDDDDGTLPNMVKNFSRVQDKSHPYYTPNKVEIGKVVSRPVTIPEHVKRPYYHRTGENNYHMAIENKTPEQIECMRQSCQLARRTLDYAMKQVAVGVTTEEIDRRVTEFILQHGAYPSPLNYGQFPKSICTSVNEVMVHGIPDDRPLKFGDVINLDITVFYKGFHGDCSATTIVGYEPHHGGNDDGDREISPYHVHMVNTTREALEAAIDICGPGVPFTRIGDAIETVVEQRCLELQKERQDELGGRVIRYTISEDFCGHGIGEHFHSIPQIIHHRNNFGVHVIGARRMMPGMTFTIEPLLVGGPTGHFVMMPDKWTVISAGRYISSQFEHTLLITEDGVEVLTKAVEEDKPEQQQ